LFTRAGSGVGYLCFSAAHRFCTSAGYRVGCLWLKEAQVKGGLLIVHTCRLWREGCLRGWQSGVRQYVIAVGPFKCVRGSTHVKQSVCTSGSQSRPTPRPQEVLMYGCVHPRDWNGGRELLSMNFLSSLEIRFMYG
jgi:hypothetical protein